MTSGAVYYSKVTPAAAVTNFEDVRKVGALYVAPLATPLRVQTPTLVLMSPLRDEDGAPVLNAHLKLPRGFEVFARDVEAAVLDAALRNKDAWFRRPLEDDVITASFKAFVKGSALKVKWPRDTPVFDADGKQLDEDAESLAHLRVRCLLELSRVSFGRTEFGAMWTVVQARVAPDTPAVMCAIDPAAEIPEADTPSGSGDDAEAHEFS